MAKKNIDELWADLVSLEPNKPELFWVIRKLSESIGEKAWTLFLKLEPTEIELVDVIKGVGFLSVRAWQEFKKRGLTRSTILNLTQSHWSVEPSLRADIWEAFLGINPTDEEVLPIVCDGVLAFEDEAVILLRQRKFSKDTLVKVILALQYRHKYRILLDDFWSAFLECEPDSAELCKIIHEVPVLRGNAFEELQKRKPTKEEWLSLFLEVPSLREKIWPLLPKTNLTKDEVWKILWRIREFTDGQRKLIWQKLNEYELSQPELLDLAIDLSDFRELVWPALQRAGLTQEDISRIREEAKDGADLLLKAEQAFPNAKKKAEIMARMRKLTTK